MMAIDEIKFYMIIYCLIAVSFSILLMGRYIRLRTGQGLAGKFGFEKIPVNMRWMPVVAGIAGMYMLIYTLLFLLQPDIQNAYWPIVAMQDTRIAMAGIVLMPLGAFIMIVSQLQLGTAYRLNLPEQKSQLITRGIYALSRNPLYMGLYMMLFAIWLMIPNWIYSVCLVFFIINYHFKITILEEPYLKSSFGDDYIHYCQRVNRYF